MKANDLRSEQIALLKFEYLIEKVCEEKVSGKRLNRSAIAAGLSAVGVASASAATKLGDNTPLVYLEDAKIAVASAVGDEAWLTQLAEIVTKGHNAIEQIAERGAFILLQANGTPKKPPAEVVQSLLTSGIL